MAKFVTIGERLSTTAPAVNKAFTERDPEPIIKRAKQQLDAGATYLDVNIGPAENDGEESLPNSTRIYNFTDQFVVGSGYTYSFTNYNPQNRLRNTHSLRVSFEMAGNLLYAFSKITNAKKDKDGLYNLFGINYSQFVKGDVDFSKSYVLDSRNKIAFHVGVGV